MNDPLPSPDRRRMLAVLAGLPVLGRARWSVAAPSFGITPALAAVPFPDGVSILVAGPENGAMDRWATLLRPALGQALDPGITMRQRDVGGADGVTGANQFDTRVAPDGHTVLLAPGEAVLDWLVGDPRAQFDVGHWMPVMACVAPAVVVGRPAAFAAGGVVRIAAAHPAGHALPAILGIELLGGRAQLIPGFVANKTLADALAEEAVDAVLLRGHKVPEQAMELASVGAVPIFALGTHDDAGALVRPAAFPNTPTLPELYTTRRGMPLSGPIRDGWGAAATASQLEFALVLPQLTPPAMVALWRRAGNAAAGALDVQAAALPLRVALLGGPAATAAVTPAAANEAGLDALRHWLDHRFNWRPA
ncbi:MAG TPA: hypothetical protein VMU81_00940 [Acetobacteraceae bacterium]|jgi:hypothetical protein|nr:hypothetical protein [Acetobacteraceae bacterium]